MSDAVTTGAMPPVVRIGSETPHALRSLLTQARVQLNALAEQLFADVRFEVPARRRQITVVAVRVASLGHTAGATFDSVAASAAQRGLAPCPLVLAPWLRLQWLGQPESPADPPDSRHQAPPGAVTVASVPPPDAPDLPWGFYLRRVDGVPWLRGYRCWSGHVWAPDDVLVFQQASPARGQHPASTPD